MCKEFLRRNARQTLAVMYNRTWGPCGGGMTTTDRTTKQLYHLDLETHTSVELGPTLRIYLAVRHLPPLSLHKGLVQ
jgi:hypothetical protein